MDGETYAVRSYEMDGPTLTVEFEPHDDLAWVLDGLCERVVLLDGSSWLAIDARLVEQTGSRATFEVDRGSAEASTLWG